MKNKIILGLLLAVSSNAFAVRTSTALVGTFVAAVICPINININGNIVTNDVSASLLGAAVVGGLLFRTTPAYRLQIAERLIATGSPANAVKSLSYIGKARIDFSEAEVIAYSAEAKRLAGRAKKILRNY